MPARATRIRIGTNPRYSMATWPRSRARASARSERSLGISVLRLLHRARVAVHRDGEGDRAREEHGHFEGDVGAYIAAPGRAAHRGIPLPRPRQVLQTRLLARALARARRRRRP